MECSEHNIWNVYIVNQQTRRLILRPRATRWQNKQYSGDSTTLEWMPPDHVSSKGLSITRQSISLNLDLKVFTKSQIILIWSNAMPNKCYLMPSGCKNNFSAIP